MHFGFSFSRDRAPAGSLSAAAVDVYGGRIGIRQSLGTAGAGMVPLVAQRQTTFAAEAAWASGP